MMLRLLANKICLVAPLLAVLSQAHDGLVHETASVPRGWQLIGDADQSEYLQLSIALAQPRLGELKKRVAEISDIEHVEFGSHLTQRQLQEYQKPDDASVSSVLDWLSAADITDTSMESAWVRINATVGAINSLLDCKLSEYETPLSARVYRTTEYSLPSGLSRHIQFVYPVTQFIEVSPQRTREDKDDTAIVPRQATSKYKVYCISAWGRY